MRNDFDEYWQVSIVVEEMRCHRTGDHGTGMGLNEKSSGMIDAGDVAFPEKTLSASHAVNSKS